jgi:predicted phosphatase
VNTISWHSDPAARAALANMAKLNKMYTFIVIGCYGQFMMLYLFPPIRAKRLEFILPTEKIYENKAATGACRL